MSTFIDAELGGLAAAIVGTKTKGKTTDYPLAISLERSPQGALIWKVWLEAGYYSVEGQGLEPSIAIASALTAFNKAKGQNRRITG